ncbi:unnamed protein product [Merluccius merluccius]
MSSFGLIVLQTSACLHLEHKPAVRRYQDGSTGSRSGAVMSTVAAAAIAARVRVDGEASACSTSAPRSRSAGGVAA